MQIESYAKVGHAEFGSTPVEVECAFGKPDKIDRDRYGTLEYYYDTFIIRFCDSDDSLRECTLLPGAEATLNGITIRWDDAFLNDLCAIDNAPQECLGGIILLSLGIAVTGFHDSDNSNKAITVFRRGDFDQFRDKMKPFTLTH